MQIDSFMQLPKDRRPPESIWESKEQLDDWFDRVYDSNKSTSLELSLDDIE
jgi:hypothetical protein